MELARRDHGARSAGVHNPPGRDPADGNSDGDPLTAISAQNRKRDASRTGRQRASKDNAPAGEAEGDGPKAGENIFAEQTAESHSVDLQF
jgi:hypothetical protein